MRVLLNRRRLPSFTLSSRGHVIWFRTDFHHVASVTFPSQETKLVRRRFEIRFDVHRAVRNAYYGDAFGNNDVEDHMCAERIASITLANFVASTARLWILRKPAKALFEFANILFGLAFAPGRKRVVGDCIKIAQGA